MPIADIAQEIANSFCGTERNTCSFNAEYTYTEGTYTETGKSRYARNGNRITTLRYEHFTRRTVLTAEQFSRLRNELLLLNLKITMKIHNPFIKIRRININYNDFGYFRKSEDYSRVMWPWNEYVIERVEV